MNRFLLPLLACAVLCACAPVPDRTADEDSLRVVTTVYPAQFLAERLAGSGVTVENIVPAGAEPHEFEPTPADIARLHGADVVVLSGGVDAWAERLIPELRAEGVTVLRLLDSAGAIPVGGHTGQDAAEHADRAAEDPHFWMDPRLMQSVASVVRDAFMAADPARAEEYRKNAESFGAEMLALDGAYREGLRACALRDVIVAHDAFGYLSDAYDLRVHAVAGISPDEEPSPRRLAELTALARDKGVTTVFAEASSPELTAVIAREAGLRLEVLDPLETISAEDRSAGIDYPAKMRHNLSVLRSALHCR